MAENEIVVTGYRWREEPEYDGEPETGIPPPTPITGGGGGSGSGTLSAPPPKQVAEHSEKCSTEDQAAASVARKVKGELPPGTSGPADPMQTPSGNTWEQVEFGTAIVSTGGGGFGAVNSAIYSNDLERSVTIPTGQGSDVRGMWHNHPVKAPVGSQEFAIDRYPSVFSNGSGDWSA